MQAVTDNDVKNLHRDYEIYVFKVLFNAWGITFAYGRQGRKGKSSNYSFKTKEEAQKFVHKTLQNRLRAVKRNGYPYRLTFVRMKEIDHTLLQEWISPKPQQILNLC